MSEARSAWADPPPTVDVTAEYFGESTLAATRSRTDRGSVWSRLSELDQDLQPFRRRVKADAHIAGMLGLQRSCN